MDDDIKYDPPELYPRRRPEKKEASPEKRPFFSTLTMQAIICLVAVIFLVLSQTFAPKLYESAKAAYQGAAGAPLTVPEELAAFSEQIISFFTQAPPSREDAASSGISFDGGSSDVSASDSSSSDKVSSVETSSGSASDTSSENFAPESSAPAESAPASSQTASAVSAIPGNTAGIVKTSVSAEDSSTPTDAPLSPPEGATFSPVLYAGNPGLPIKNATLSSGFGYRISPITGELEFHRALDLAAPEGTPIYAAASGRVIAAEYSSSLGYYITIQHTGGFVTRYGHCSELIAPQGAVVRQGEVIAKVGATGEATGNHLHFEMSISGVVFDPAWLYDYD